MAQGLWPARRTGAPAAQPHGADARTAYVAATFCWLLSAGVYIAAKWASADMPPWTLTFWRPLIAGVILLPFVARQYGVMRAELAARPLMLLTVGGLGLAISQGCIYTGLHHTTAVNAGLIIALAPIITLVAAHFVLQETLGRWQAVGSLIALAGMIVIITAGRPSALLRLDINIGDLWMIGAAIFFSAYSVLLRHAKFSLPTLPLLVLLLASGAIVALPFYLWELARGEYAHMNPPGLLALAYVAIPGGALMYYLYNYSIEVIGAARAGVFLYLQIFFVAVLAWLFLGEHLEPYHYEGGGLIILGVVLVTLLK